MNFLCKVMLVLALCMPVYSFAQDNPVGPVNPIPVVTPEKFEIVGLDKENKPIVAPEFITSGKMVKLSVTGAPKDSRYIWDILPLNVADIDIDKNVLRFTSKSSNMPFYVRVFVISADNIKMLDHSVVINDNGPLPPTPNPVDPPGPTPDPKPKKDEFRVLVLTEMDDISLLPASQAAALYSGKFYDFLNEKCIKDKDNRPDWRFLDDDLSETELSKMEPYWVETYKKAKADALAAGTNGKPLYPWVVFSNPAKEGVGEAGPYPDTAEKALSQAKKWAP